MLCDSFQELTVIEKRDLIGSLAHAVMNDDECFELGCKLLNHAQKKGILDNVVILPERTDSSSINDLA